MLLALARLDLRTNDGAAAKAGFERVIEIHVERHGNQRELAQARFGLAQSLPDAERAQAITLAKQARERFSADELADEVARIDAWLADHPA